MKLSLTHFNKPSNKKLKLIADIAIYSLLLYNPIIMAMPLPTTTISWLLTVSNTVIVGFKVFTKLTKEEDINEKTEGVITNSNYIV